MNNPPKPPGPSPAPEAVSQASACPECGSREVTDTEGNPLAHGPTAGVTPRPVHVVRLKCKRGHVWSPA